MEKSYRRIRYYVYGVPLLLIVFLIALVIYTPKPSRLLVIGLDAADWDIIDTLIEAGRIPNIERIVEGGVRGKLETIEPSISAALWTSISTGVSPHVHGITDFVIPGQGPLPFSSGMRKVPAIWNIASYYGKRVGIVGHWMTWPAEKVNGQIVSSFISYKPGTSFTVEYRGKLEEVVDLPDKAYPPEFAREILPLVITKDDVTTSDLDRFFNIDDWSDPDLYEKELRHSMTYLVPFFYAADKSFLDIFDYMRHDKGPYDYLFTYVEGTDSNAHRFWQFHDPTYLEEAMKHWGYDLSNKDKYIRYFGDTINRYYEWVDERIGNVINEMGPRDTLIILSDHGFGPYTEEDGEYSKENEGHTFSGSHAHFGILLMYGANVKQGYRLQGQPPKVLDIVPTALTLMKLPMANYIEGRVIWDAISPRFAATYRERWINSYGMESQFGKQSRQSPFDEDLVERMKSLGYLQ